jgi:hypothetical protein
MVNEKINKIITRQYQFDFSLDEDGLYLIEIIASAKSWWQKFKSSRSLAHLSLRILAMMIKKAGMNVMK